MQVWKGCFCLPEDGAFIEMPLVNFKIFRKQGSWQDLKYLKKEEKKTLIHQFIPVSLTGLYHHFPSVILMLAEVIIQSELSW